MTLKASRVRSRAERGFTMLEVLVAMFVLGTAVSSLFVLLSRSLGNVERAEAVNRALSLGRSKLNEILITHRATGSSPAEDLLVGNLISGRWDEFTRWEASAALAHAESAATMPAVAPVQIALRVYWKRNANSRENSVLLETTQLWPVDRASLTQSGVSAP